MRRGLAERARDAGIGDQHALIRKQDVLRFEIAVRDLGGVRSGEPAQNAAHDLDGARERNRAVVPDPGPERGAGNERTRVIDERTGTARATRPDEIGMIQPLADQEDGALELQVIDAQ